MNCPLVFFDLEATGLEISRDRIVEIAMLKWGDPEEEFHTLVNPEMPIPPESTAIHGITDEMVKDAPKFKDIAHRVMEFINGCDVAGYNCRNFDVPLLWEELYRAKYEWKMDDVAIIDVCTIFKLQHPRDLEAAVKLYCQREHVGKHRAIEDVKATCDVFTGQLATHADLMMMGRKGLAEYCEQEEKRADLSGIIVFNEAGVPVFNTRRNKGVAVGSDIGYAQWILRNDFSRNTKLTIERILNS